MEPTDILLSSHYMKRITGHFMKISKNAEIVIGRNSYRENYNRTTHVSNETEIISITECRKTCPEKYIMSVDCEFCFMFGEWLANNGDRVSLMVGKKHAVKFCEMHSNDIIKNKY